MTTLSQIQDAHDQAPRHRFALRDLVKVDQSKVSAGDQALIDKLHGAKTPAEFDAAVHDIAVNKLFLRGVLYIGEKKP